MRVMAWWILLGLLCLSRPARADEPVRLPTDAQVQIERSTVVAAERYVRPDPHNRGAIVIRTDGVTLDLGGAELVGTASAVDPDRYGGTAIVVTGAKDVVIRNGRIHGYKVAVRAEDAPGLTIEDVDASGNYRQRLGSTPEREDAADWLWPHKNDKGEWTQRYGAAFSLTRCNGAHVRRCTVNDGQNGLLLTRCNLANVYDNDFSFNSGWGIGMYRSSQCHIAHNRCDWCVRGYSHGVYSRGQDSAGILVFEQCTNNVFVRNSATHSGDGFFLYAGHETTQRTGLGGSGGNVVAYNDFRYAVANGIEATFSKGNVFYRNDCSGADHGVWAGYSRHTLIAGNTIKDCMTAGVSIEHGHHNRILHNRIAGGRYGIHLWWDEDKVFLEGPFGKHQDTSSSKNVIEGNEISDAQVALRLWDDQASTVRGNRLGATHTILELGPDTELALLAHNLVQGAHGPHHERLPELVKNRTGEPFVLPGENLLAGRFKPLPPRRGPNRVTRGGGTPAFLNTPAPAVSVPACPGSLDTALPDDMPVGRQEMRIGPFGPLDPRKPHVMPARRSVSGREAVFHVLGRSAWKARVLAGAVELVDSAGEAPGRVVVRARRSGPGQPAGLVPFRLAVDVGGARHEVAGVLVDTIWRVHFFHWKTDPREDAQAFASLLASDPVAVLRTGSLTYPWQSGHPEGVRADRFATLATTEVELGKGTYRIRTTSDDGIRVYVDGKRVIDNWTHHAPTEDTATLDLAAGKHAFRVEHFELDGWAYLSFVLEPVR